MRVRDKANAREPPDEAGTELFGGNRVQEKFLQSIAVTEI
jgi:hypothetical protein